MPSPGGSEGTSLPVDDKAEGRVNTRNCDTLEDLHHPESDTIECRIRRSECQTDTEEWK